MQTTSAALAAGRQGLPLCRVYARFWGGDITLMNVENWGCSFLIRLPKERSVVPPLSCMLQGGGQFLVREVPL